MATYTDYFSLTKPDLADNADIAVLNQNTTKIDLIMHQNRQMSADAYDTTETYDEGDIVIYENVLYKCKADNVSGNWDSTKWEVTTLAKEIANGGGGGGDASKTELTQAQYDALVQAGTVDPDMMYFITDGQGGGGGSSEVSYSTTEHKVGTWIDGKDVYERTIDLGSFSVGSWSDHTIESSTNIDLLIDYDGYMVESNIMYALPDPSVRIKVDSSQNLIFTGTSSWSISSGHITIRYTKSSS